MIIVPVKLYTLEDVRQQISDWSTHSYRIGTVQRAVREGILESLKIDDRTVLVTPEAVEEYFWKYCKYAPRRPKNKKPDDNF